MLNWYSSASTTIGRFIVGGMQDETILSDEMRRLAGATASSDNESLRNDLNMEAIESFINSYDELDLKEFQPSLGSNDAPKLNISGVELSIRPEIELRGPVRGNPAVGAIKLYFSKPDTLGDLAAQYGAVAIKQYCEQYLAAGAKVRPADCMVFDVFAGQLYTAPTAVTLRIKDITAACEEIALRWDSI